MERIFSTLDPKALSEIARHLRWDPLTRRNPLTLLSELEEEERLAWLDAHRAKLAEEVCSVGSQTFGRTKPYPEIVQDLANKLGAKFSLNDATPDIEQSLIKKFVENAWENLPPEEQTKFKKKIEQEAAQHGKSVKGEMAGFAALATAQLSGFGVYMLASSLLGAINGALGLGLSFGVFAGLSSMISIAIGPIGWAAVGLVAVAKLGAPNYKKLLPVIILVALERQNSSDGSPDLMPSLGPSTQRTQLLPTVLHAAVAAEGIANEGEYDLIAREFEFASYSAVPEEKDKKAIREMHRERLKIETPVARHEGDRKPISGQSIPPKPGERDRGNGKASVILRKGDEISQIPGEEIDDLRNQYRRIWPHLEFAPDALDRLLRLDGRERTTLEGEFGRMNLGDVQSKSSISGTAPKIWELGADKQRIYFRKTASEKWMIELVGGKSGSSQDRDCRTLRRKFRPKS